MNFIDQESAKQISEWQKKHPKEAEEFAKFHREQYELFRSHKISYQEFSARHENWRKSHINE